jgi:hypothetical protein
MFCRTPAAGAKTAKVPKSPIRAAPNMVISSEILKESLFMGLF